MIFFVNTKHVKQLHSAIVSDSGGSDGLRDLGLLESAIASQWQTVFVKDAYESLSEKCAALMFFIIKNHAFVDGNKRTGTLAAIMLLAYNDYKLVATKRDIVKTAIGVATGNVSLNDLSQWFIERIEKK